jgi:hypothetical protein
LQSVPDFAALVERLSDCVHRQQHHRAKVERVSDASRLVVQEWMVLRNVRGGSIAEIRINDTGARVFGHGHEPVETPRSELDPLSPLHQDNVIDIAKPRQKLVHPVATQ